MPNVITIGSALVDVFIHSPEFVSKSGQSKENLTQHFGDKVELDSFHVYSGGGASNTAVGLSRLGFDVGVIAETGRDGFSQIVLQEFAKEGVDTSLLIKEKKEQTGGSVIMVGEKGQRIVMVHRGASSMLDAFDIPTFWLSKAKWVHLSSIAGREEALAKIFSILSSHGDVSLSWNPGKAELELLASGKIKIVDVPCRVFIVNRQEWEMIADVQKEALAKFPQVIVTNGSQGGDVYIDGQHKWSYPSRGVESIDDTGAGDAFTAGYVAAQIFNKDPLSSVAWGIENASSVIRYYGAKTGLLRRDDLEKVVVEEAQIKKN